GQKVFHKIFLQTVAHSPGFAVGACCQYLDAFFGDRNGVLEMSAWLAILGRNGPVIREQFDALGAHIDHWFDSNHHAWFQLKVPYCFILAGDVIWHLWYLPHVVSDAMPYQSLDD